jgi:acetyl esterase/lipase
MIRWIVTVCVAASALTLPSRSGWAEDAPQISADVVYGHKDGMALTFDVIKPAQPNGAAVIYIPTGGWYSPYFDPKIAVGAGQPLLEKGFALFVLRHGGAPKYTVPETVADVQRGVRFIKLHAADFGVDANRLGVYGASAGGHLTLMLATTGDDGKPDEKDDVLKGSSRVACVVAIFPPTDLRGWTTDPPEEIKKHAGLKPPLTFNADLEDDVSPLLHVSEKTPPVLLIHGDKDTLVPISHSQNILPVLEKAKVESKLLTIDGAGHGFNPDQQKVVNDAMVEWFVSHLAK